MSAVSAPNATSAPVLASFKPFSNGQLEQYRYKDDVAISTVQDDLKLLDKEWNLRVQKAIRDDAATTNGWSLLWKLEAAYETVNNKIDKLLLEALEQPQFKRYFMSGVITPVSVRRTGGQGMENNGIGEFLKQNANLVSAVASVATSVAPAAATIANALVSAAANGASQSINNASSKTTTIADSTSADSKSLLPSVVTTIFPNDLMMMDVKTKFGLEDSDMKIIMNDLSSRIDLTENNRAAGATVAGAAAKTFEEAMAKYREMLEWSALRLQLERQTEKMFRQLTSWTQCDGRLLIPEVRPPVDGFNHLTARLVEWLVWPFLSPGVFRTQRQAMVYGPAGAGKTVVAQLATFDMARAMAWADLRASTVNITNNVDRTEQLRQRLRSVNLNDYVTVYFIDAMKLRSKDAEKIGERLRNYLNCLQYDVTRAKARTKKKKLAVAIIDNLDALFMTDEELKAQPRAERKASQIKSWIYKAAPDIVSRIAGATQTNTKTPSVRFGGQAAPNTTTSGTTSSRSVTEVVSNLLSASSLEADWPDVRLIWSPRYAWKLPEVMLDSVKQRQLFVDLPSNRIRRSYLESLLRDDFYANVANRIIEEEKMSGAEATKLDERNMTDADQRLYNKERDFAKAIMADFWAEWTKWQRLPIKPLASNLMRSIVNGPLGIAKGYKRLSDDYLREMAATLDFITTATGMSLEGFCKLQSDYGLSFAEVDMFLITTGRKRDGLAGSTPFGYTLEDLNNLFMMMKAQVNQRLLKQAFEMKKAFIFGSTRFAAQGCKQTAADIERKRGELASADPLESTIQALGDWKKSDGELSSCEVAVGPDLTDIKTGKQVLPLWARYGSHRILKIDDAMTTLSNFDRYVTPKPDYPEFVTFVLYRVPKLNRGLLPPSQLSQMCRVRPGPASAFLYPSTGKLRIDPNNLVPWSVLFTPTPKLTGGGGGSRGGGISKIGGKAKRSPNRHHTTSRTPQNHFPIDLAFTKQQC
jgi:hypothetical protein